MEPTPRHVQRIAISLLTAGGLVVGGFVAAAPTGTGRGDLPSTYDAQARERAEVRAERRPHTHREARPAPPRRRGGRRRRPRADDPIDQERRQPQRRGGRGTRPHHPTQRAASLARVAAQRTQREPRLTDVPREQASRGPGERVRHGRRLLPPRGEPADLPGDRPRHLPALRPRPHVPRRVGTDGATSRRRRRRSRTGPCRRSAGPVHLHPRRRPLAAEGDGGLATGAAEASRCVVRPGARRSPRSTPTCRAARSVASRPSRRSAAGSTRTSTGRPTSSSAAA